MSKRSNMLASVVRALVAPVLPECPPECGMVSITEVEVSDDCLYATVFLSALKEPEKAIAFFEHHRRHLQRKMSTVERKQLPILRFRIDPRTERGSRIEKLLS
jgi:ribosome-binding factor A